MTVYTIHYRAEVADSPAGQTGRAIAVADGFSWGAFWLPLIWLAGHRLWLPLIAVAAVKAAIVITVVLAWLPGDAAVALWFLVHLYAGLEGNEWRRRRLEAKRFLPRAVIVDDTPVAAERRYFAALLAAAETGSRS